MISLRIMMDDLFPRNGEPIQPRPRVKKSKVEPIKVKDEIILKRRVRRVTIECSFDYPGLNEADRALMDEGVAKIAEAYERARMRLLREEHYKRQEGVWPEEGTSLS